MKKRKDYISDIYYSMKITKKDFNIHVENILSEKQYSIFKMRFNEDGNVRMTADEIAKQLGTTKQAVDSVLNKIYAKIIILCKRLNIDVDINMKIERVPEIKKPTISKHATELISSIAVLKRLPGEKRLNNMVSEKVFSDNGADQRNYYDHLLSDIKFINKKIEKNEHLNKLEKQKLLDFKAIVEELEKHKVNRNKKQSRRKIDSSHLIVELRKKTIEFIKYLNTTHKLPENKYADYFNTGIKFEDGTDMRNFYVALRYKAKVAKEKFDKGEMISDLDREKIIALKLIDNVLSFYPCRFYDNKLMLLELVNSLKIDIAKNKLLLSKSYGEVYVKIRFLIENNIPIVDCDGNINSILYMNNEELKNNYNISINDLTNIYLNGIISSKLSEEVIKKMCKK